MIEFPRFPSPNTANAMRLMRACAWAMGCGLWAWTSILADAARGTEPRVFQPASVSTHWAYQPPRRPPLPVVSLANWPRNAIDSFTLATLERHSWSPAPEADRHTLIRRLTFDLTGLPPTMAEIEAFARDEAPEAYERLVDRLLASPRFGERMATPWLDQARYADTHGYHMDAHRDMWRWRDWVIGALNDNQPYDQFTIEQLAGDLLPHPTLAQRIATGFHRNTMVNFENGALAEEFLSEYVVDRVTTTATVWLGQTLVCARCHDHKYDPFTQRDFFRLYAFFHNVPELGVDGDKGNAAPFIPAPLPHQAREIDELTQRISALEMQLAQRAATADAAVLAWGAGRASETRVIAHAPAWVVTMDEGADELVDSWQGQHISIPGKHGEAWLFDGQTHFDLKATCSLDQADGFTIGVWVFPTTRDAMTILEQPASADRQRRVRIGLDGDKIVCHVANRSGETLLRVESSSIIARSRWQHVVVQYAGSGEASGIRLYVDGTAMETVKCNDAAKDPLQKAPSQPNRGLRIGQAFRGILDELRAYPSTLNDDEIAMLAGGDPIGELLTIEPDQRTTAQQERLERYYLEQVDKPYRESQRQLHGVRDALAKVVASVPTTMVMREMDMPRLTYVLNNGRYDSRGELVTAGVPEVLPPLSDDSGPNRLALARWLVQPDHPLTSRVAVNQFWQRCFGAGLVRTPEDFGTRGELPTHPELLDWLAVEFASDWDVKRLIRMMVTSATYRQSHQYDTDLARLDPENRWLARAARRRLTAEMIRDNALAISGLLVEEIGGPSVFPYQPPGIWEEIAYNSNDFTAQSYRQSHGRDLYRRSLYTFFKRSAPAPLLVTFDAPNRETCQVERGRTNTPEQALSLMNDVTFVEAARVLAQQVWRMNTTTEARIRRMFYVATGREANSHEAQVLLELNADLWDQYRAQPELARRLLQAGESPRDETIDTAELAAAVAVANVLLSLDEVITRP